ncbi:hypothetical protein DITRI_Ditri10aG0103600 [Diplodiscus trichospermus]
MPSVSIAAPFPCATQKRVHQPISESFISPLPLSPLKAVGSIIAKVQSQASSASFKEKAMTVLTEVALTASMVIPEVAQAVETGVSPSLRNFLFNIVAGGVVLAAIIGAVIGVANFDPIKRTCGGSESSFEFSCPLSSQYYNTRKCSCVARGYD